MRSSAAISSWSRRLEDLDLGMTLDVETDVIERPHPLLGWVWGPELPDEQPVRRRLKAHSQLTLLVNIVRQPF